MGNFRQHVNRKRKERERKRNRRNAKMKSKEESDSMKNIAKALRKSLVISPSDHPRQNLAENAVSHDCHHIRSAAVSCAKYCFGENSECFNKMDSPVSYDEIMDTPERPSKGRSPSSKSAMEDGDSSPRGRRLVKRKTNRRRVKEEIDRIEQEQYRRFIGISTGLRRESSDGDDQEEEEDEDEEIDVVGIYPRPVPPGYVNKALQKMRVAQFRIINEMLYTTQSEKAAELFCEDRKNFDVYHEGYRHQVTKWLLNPLDKIISVIQESFPPTTKIADLGCGEAKLAVTLKPLGYTVHSFDLVATNEHVQECNIRDVPLQAESVDVAVMCLSLMGTDMGQFVLEANRILVANGELIIAEVESRLPSDDSFEKMMKRYGFALKFKDTARIFHFFGFRKAKPVPKGAEKNMDTVLSLKPCLYKKR